jgi:xanthine dehydrogenase accessory factor
LKLLILGHGEESIALARLALTFGAEVELLSPELAIVDAAAACGAKTGVLETPESVSVDADRWTAVVLLFHDHDWEPRLLAQALNSPAFFIGAMGSRATHEARIARVRSLGFCEEAVARIHGPLGLIPAARDPQMLALSALAQVADHYRGAAA